jgi:hypothetical protein
MTRTADHVRGRVGEFQLIRTPPSAKKSHSFGLPLSWDVKIQLVSGIGG